MVVYSLTGNEANAYIHNIYYNVVQSNVLHKDRSRSTEGRRMRSNKDRGRGDTRRNALTQVGPGNC